MAQCHRADPALKQHEHWEGVYQRKPRLFGDGPSATVAYAVSRFSDGGARRVLELGAGHGRDTVHLARAGFEVVALDFSATGLAVIQSAAADAGVGSQIKTLQHDVRERLPVADESFDAAYAHLLLCMDLSTPEILALSQEIRRVLVLGGCSSTPSATPATPTSVRAWTTATTSTKRTDTRCTSSTTPWFGRSRPVGTWRRSLRMRKGSCRVE